MTGLLLGLQEAGADITGFDRVIGTSAGATVAAQITSGTALMDLYRGQVEADRQVAEYRPAIHVGKLLMTIIPGLLRYRTPLYKKPEKFNQYLGRHTLGLARHEFSRRRDVIAARLPNHNWPQTSLLITAIDSQSGLLHLFDKDSGVDLVDAVAASCAVPGVWPAVPIQGRYYMDGGVGSSTNAVYAEGARQVLVIAPLASAGLGREVAQLRQGGSDVKVITPDAAAKQAMGKNPLNPALRESAAKAGREQGCKIGGGLF